MNKVLCKPLRWQTTLFVIATIFSALATAQPPGPEQVKAMMAELSGQPTETVIYKGVSVIDATGAPLQKNMAIIVKGEVIEDIVPIKALKAKKPEGARVVDAKGQYVVPGLVDSHVHMATLPNRQGAEAYGNRYLYAGITTGRDMAGDTRAVANFARDALLKAVPSPDIYFSALMAGPSFFDDPRTFMSAIGVQRGEVPWMQAITDETDLKIAVAMARGTGAAGIKVYANLPGPLVQNIITEAHRQDFKVWTHLQVYPAIPDDSFKADGVSHICMIPRYVLGVDTEKYSHDRIDNLSDFSVDHPAVKRIFNGLAKNDTTLDVTISLLNQGGGSGEPVLSDCTYEIATDLARAAYKAGVRIAAGTDYGTPPEELFPALHRELEALSDDVGMTTMDALRAGSINGAILLGLEDQIGTIEKGKLANLVFLEKNPLEDISNLRSVITTLKRGTAYPRKDYIHQKLPEGGPGGYYH